MGEANYYLKAEFENEKLASRAYTIARKVFEDLAEFESDWQNCRGIAQPIKSRHDELLKKHKLVKQFITIPEPAKEDDTNMNYLAGECEMPSDFEMRLSDKTIYLNAEVWHMATWDNINEFFFRLGAVACGWVSDEYLDPWQSIDLGNNDVDNNKMFDEELLKNMETAFKLIGEKRC